MLNCLKIFIYEDKNKVKQVIYLSHHIGKPSYKKVASLIRRRIGNGKYIMAYYFDPQGVNIFINPTNTLQMPGLQYNQVSIAKSGLSFYGGEEKGRTKLNF